MTLEYILAIDQGTTNTKALLVDSGGAVVAETARPLAVRYPQPAWVEQDPLELWQSVTEAAAACVGAAPSGRVAAVALTNQRESVLVWERTSGQPLGPCITWQCRRSADFCRELVARGLEPFLRGRTGLTINPLFSAGKARWLLDQTPHGHARAAAGELCIGTVDSWVLWNLTNGAVHATDMTNAARTQLFNLHTLAWDDELLDLFGVPRAALPEVRPSSALYGETIAPGLPAGAPIAALIGDSHGALYGHAGFQPGAIKATYGTGSSLMTPMPTPIISQGGLSTTVAWARERAIYALEGNISVTGAAVQWLAHTLGIEGGGQGVELLAGDDTDAGGVYFVPAFVGLGAPYWVDSARGEITGITRGTTPQHLARATLHSIAYQVRDVFDVMQAESGQELTMLLADGGASRNDRLMQFQADMIGRPVMRSLASDVSALGAAYLAGLAVGVWQSEADIAALPRPHDCFKPQMGEDRRAELYAGWKKAVARAIFEP